MRAAGFGGSGSFGLLRAARADWLSGDLARLLHAIAAEAMALIQAEAAVVLRRVSDGGLEAAVSIGLAGSQVGLVQIADRLEPVAVDDIATDRLFAGCELADARRLAIEAGYNSMLSVPLVADSRDLGALNLFRRGSGSWGREEIAQAAILAQHVAGSIAMAGLLDSQRLQLGALERMAGMLGEQAHDYANRLHALSGMLALGEADEAERVLSQLAVLHHETCSSVEELVLDTTLAGLLVAQMNAGRQRGVEVRLHRGSRIGCLPPTVLRTETMIIIANLVENAIDATVGMEKARRRVSLRLNQGDARLTLTVRDWGEGIDQAEAEAIVERAGRGTPEDDYEAGLVAVAQAVWSAGGEIAVRPGSPGTCFRVSLPLS